MRTDLINRQVNTPDGVGLVCQLRHSGGLIVRLGRGVHREFLPSQVSMLDRPAREAGSDDDDEPEPIREPAPGLCPEEETAAALARLKQETRARLERVWIAHRLELVLRARTMSSV